jgi:hypothetical protein
MRQDQLMRNPPGPFFASLNGNSHQVLCQATGARKVFAIWAENLAKVSDGLRIKTKAELVPRQLHPLDDIEDISAD